MSQPDRLHATQVFFDAWAAGWEERHPEDGYQFERAVREMHIAPGATALDLGCGTGRATVPLRATVGAQGHVFALDVTAGMLLEAVRLGRQRVAAFLFGDTLQLPFPDGCADVLFAGGLLPHLDDIHAGLREMARVTRRGGILAVFHPVGRVTLAARHNQVPSDDDVIAPARLGTLLTEHGWQVLQVDDAAERYLALAQRV